MSGLEEIKIDSRERGSGGPENTAWEQWRVESRDYNVELLKKCDEYLNITLTIAGLLSAAISAFIVYIHPQLQSDPIEESATLLPVLLFGMYNSIIRGDVTRVPRWSGPCLIFATQVLLYISLAATLASALLAVLAKRLLNQCASTRLWRPNSEQGQHELRRFTLSIDVVLFTSPFLLKFAIMFFSFALSLYLWMLDAMIATFVPILTLGILLSFPSHPTVASR